MTKKIRVRVVKSPLPYRVREIPASSSYGAVTVSIMLPNGTMVTKPEQFEDHESKTVEVYSEETPAP